MRNKSFFNYIHGSSFFHKMNAGAKVLFFVAFSIASIFFPLSVICACMLLVFISLNVAKLNIKNELTVMRFVLLYSLVIYGTYSVAQGKWGLPSEKIVLAIARMMLLLHVSLLLFCTTSFLQIRRSLCSIEKRFTHKAVVSHFFALFLSFIPDVFALLGNLEYAYDARTNAGRPSKKRISKIISKTITVFTALFSVSFYTAQKKERAFYARRTMQ
ncbi:MAG: hypothetical protein Ta2A_19960 [Treponemataceae bacterium]|nr:MAG: hypothetical protein Ta2A_19960 [Treponemataceae bacterium]